MGKISSVGDERASKTLAPDSNCNTTRKLYVKGTAFFGSDLGSDGRPEPVGSFTMMEVNDGGYLLGDEDGDDDESDNSKDRENTRGSIQIEEGFE